jgi:hypothetical protein
MMIHPLGRKLCESYQNLDAEGLPSQSICLFPEGRDYRERWTPFRPKGDGGFRQFLRKIVKNSVFFRKTLFGENKNPFIQKGIGV